MTDKLFQKHLLKGTREFELTADAVDIKIDMPFLKKEFTVVVAILDPEPVRNGSTLAFVSAVNREPLIEMFIDKPDPESFNAFVTKIRDMAIAEDYGKPKTMSDRDVDVAQLEMTLQMLRTYLGDEHSDFLQALEALKAEPQSEQRYREMFEAFNALGPAQGAILTYAPYIVTLLSDNEPS